MYKWIRLTYKPESEEFEAPRFLLEVNKLPSMYSKTRNLPTGSYMHVHDYEAAQSAEGMLSFYGNGAAGGNLPVQMHTASLYTSGVQTF